VVKLANQVVQLSPSYISCGHFRSHADRFVRLSSNTHKPHRAGIGSERQWMRCIKKFGNAALRLKKVMCDGETGVRDRGREALAHGVLWGS
jgi:hypothetical protein